MLNKKEIEQLIKEKGLVEEYINLDQQLTPNGFDLTVGKIFEFDSAGALDFSNSQRVIPQGKEFMPKKRCQEDKYGWWELSPGAYKARTNEVVNLPNNLAALGFSRTSLLRMGAFTQNGIWDAGFKGRGEFILVVSNSQGVSVKQNARLVQLMFISIDETEEYQGIYKHLV
ncbi:MAG: deoxyuridine 5'-triphosphate nucleotidohydrolase [Candidatus Omnitrophota bacterium]